MGLKFMFEPLANGLIDEVAHIITSAGLPFGFGGIARVGEGIIPGEMCAWGTHQTWFEFSHSFKNLSSKK